MIDRVRYRDLYHNVTYNNIVGSGRSFIEIGELESIII